MPKLSVWMVRASLIHMGIGFLFGALILYHKGIPLYGWVWHLLTPHIEMMIFGWTMQLVMGVAFWILPRFASEGHPHGRYGRTDLAWWSFIMLNAGVICASLGGWFAEAEPVLIGRLLILVAVAFFAVVIWPRVKPLGGFVASKNS